MIEVLDFLFSQKKRNKGGTQLTDHPKASSQMILKKDRSIRLV